MSDLPLLGYLHECQIVSAAGGELIIEGSIYTAGQITSRTGHTTTLYHASEVQCLSAQKTVPDNLGKNILGKISTCYSPILYYIIGKGTFPNII